MHKKTKDGKHMHKSQDRARPNLGLCLLVLHPPRVVGSSWIPVPLLESPDRPTSSQHLPQACGTCPLSTAGPQGPLPTSITHRVTYSKLLWQPQSVLRSCFREFTAAFSKVQSTKLYLHPVFHVKRVPHHKQSVNAAEPSTGTYEQWRLEKEGQLTCRGAIFDQH
jgi:hypothetical protein